VPLKSRYGTVQIVLLQWGCSAPALEQLDVAQTRWRSQSVRNQTVYITSWLWVKSAKNMLTFLAWCGALAGRAQVPAERRAVAIGTLLVLVALFCCNTCWPAPGASHEAAVGSSVGSVVAVVLLLLPEDATVAALPPARYRPCCHVRRGPHPPRRAAGSPGTQLRYELAPPRPAPPSELPPRRAQPNCSVADQATSPAASGPRGCCPVLPMGGVSSAPLLILYYMGQTRLTWGAALPATEPASPRSVPFRVLDPALASCQRRALVAGSLNPSSSSRSRSSIAHGRPTAWVSRPGPMPACSRNTCPPSAETG